MPVLLLYVVGTSAVRYSSIIMPSYSLTMSSLCVMLHLEASLSRGMRTVSKADVHGSVDLKLIEFLYRISCWVGPKATLVLDSKGTRQTYPFAAMADLSVLSGEDSLTKPKGCCPKFT